MEVLYPRCAGLDVHKDSVVACIRIASGGEVVTEVQTFNTTTASLVSLSEWLASNGCTHVAMEATGVYWKPSGAFVRQRVHVGARQCRTREERPGPQDRHQRRDLVGRSAGSWSDPSELRAESETQDMRALLRTRKQLVREKASHIQRLQKTLEDANIKLDSVVADIVGKSGRAIIDALIAGESDPAKLAALADTRIRSSQNKLRDALSGRIRRHHRFMLNLHLQQINALDAAITEIDREVDANLAPFRTGVELLTSIPGISTLSAQVILSEIGTT